MPRPSKLTTDTVDRLVFAITHGSTYDLAAKYAGISPSTFFEWKAEAEKAAAKLVEPDVSASTAPPLDAREAALLDFLLAVEQAEGMAAVGWLQKIEVAATEGEWRAAAWMLERRHPKQYGRHVVEHDGAIGMSLPAALAAAIEKAYGDDNGDGEQL
ncbi:MAG: hypothetical protein IPO81_09535 [Kouleothrix sp.]|nr:hypothetical protein [Kouleothrix sp.]